MTTTLPTNIKRTGLTSHPINVTDDAQNKSSWSTPRKHGWFLRSKFLRWLCCVDDTLLEQIEQECSVRDAIRDAMVVHETHSGREAVVESMKEVYQETGYDLGRCAEAERERNEAERVARQAEEAREEHEYFNSLSDSERELWGYRQARELRARTSTLRIGNGGPETHVGSMAPEPSAVVVLKPKGRAMVVPKFTASVVLALRAKFGKLAVNDANRLLIEREYLKLCRDTSVRNVDVELHRQWVMNTFFNEGITDECATVRTRVPRWLREAFGGVPNAAPVVC